MLDLKEKVRRLLSTNLPIVLQGESGTGKGILSKFIHNSSTGRVGAYVKVTCASDDTTLLDSFTSTLVADEHKVNGGTLAAQPGRTQIGTLFLEEVGELSSARQARLVHLLLDRQDYRDNDRSTLWTNARIIGATARNLRQEVNENRFRRDLFYQLAVVTLDVPPLRNRLDDLLIIANYLRQRYSESFRLPDRPFPDKLIERMHYHGWPGNIRELENFVCRYVVLGPGERVFRELNSSTENAVAPGMITTGETLLKAAAKRTLADVEREMIVKALGVHNGSLKRAAHTLGISYRTLMNKMDQAGLPRRRHGKKSSGVREINDEPRGEAES